MDFTNIILLVLFVWVIALTIFGFYIFNFFKSLTRGVSKENLIAVLERVLKGQGDEKQKVEEINRELSQIVEKSQIYLQKVGFVRFNPFEELGGDHSFSVALLDAKDSGLILTGLHTRERTRIYVKNIKRGKPELELSIEEKQALKLAQK